MAASHQENNTATLLRWLGGRGCGLLGMYWKERADGFGPGSVSSSIKPRLEGSGGPSIAASGENY